MEFLFVVRDEVDAIGTRPELRKSCIIQENIRGIGEERAVPQAVDAAVEDKDLLAGVVAHRRSVGIFAVVDDVLAGLQMLLDGDGELLRAEDWIENAEGDMRALDEDDHHGGECPVGGLRLAAAAEEPIEERAEEESQRGADKRPAEEAHGVAREIEHVAERKRVEIGILVEKIKEFRARSRHMSLQSERACDAGNQQAEDEKDGSGTAPSAGDW